MKRNSPVKYSRWIEEAPETEYSEDRGGPLISLVVLLVLVGMVFGLLALVG
jgi:hypothetical protein